MTSLQDVCGDEPGTVCRFVWERTDNEALAKALGWLAGIPLRVVLVLAVSWLTNRLVRRAIRRLTEQISGAQAKGHLLAGGEVNPRADARARTISNVLRSLTTAAIGVTAFIYILGILGVSVAPLVASAGIAGIAIGFGAQSLVRDVVAGIFILIEDQYGVGDVVDVGEASGTVEGVTLRATRLRDVNGTVWHVPNGEIRRVGNKSQQWAMSVLDIAVAPTADLDRAATVIDEAVGLVWEAAEGEGDMLDRPEVLGVDYLGPDAAIIRIQGKTRPGGQWRVSRLLRVRIAEALVAAGIELPPSTYMRSGGTR